MKRSAERLHEIDSFLRIHYKDQGGRFCADGLGEKIGYISSRVQHIGLVGKPKVQAKMGEVAILNGKLYAKNKEIDELMDLLRKQKKLFNDLRIENEMLIHEKVKWKIRNDNQKNVQ